MNQLNPMFALLSNSWVLVPVLIWTLFWKGCALWIASKNNKKLWFWVLLVLNTLGILEIIYIFAIAKKNWSGMEEIFSKTNTTDTTE